MALLYRCDEANCAPACFPIASPKSLSGAGKQKAVLKHRFNRFNFLKKLERAMGFEPTTFSLGS